MSLSFFCHSCQIELRCTQSGVVIAEMTETAPYALYLADLYECKNCFNTKQFNWARTPYMQDDVEKMKVELKRLKEQGTRIFEVWATLVERNKYQLAELLS